MPIDKAHLHKVLELIWKCCFFGSARIISLLLRTLVNLVDLHCIKDQVSMEPIDISSDSDVEISDVEESERLPDKASTSGRALPAWAFSMPSSRAGSTAKFSGVNPPEIYYGVNGNLINFDNSSSEKVSTQHSSNRSIVDIDQLNSHVVGTHLFPIDGPGYSQEIDPHKFPAFSELDNDKILSQQASRRMLPASVHSNARNSRIENLYNGIITGQKTMHHSADLNSLNGPSYNPEISQRSDEDLIIYEKKESRVLPPSIRNGKATFFSSSAGSSCTLPRVMGGDERIPGNDERLIFRAVLEDLSQPKTEVDVPSGLLSVSLLKHQKIALQWMLNRETRSLHCLGGILADDQGLGKTVSMIALIQMQKLYESNCKVDAQHNKDPESLNLDEDDDNMTNALEKEIIGESSDSKVNFSGRTSSGRRPAAGTLVVSPASVLRQWGRELDEKVSCESKLDVLVYHGGNRTKDPVELAKYDVVLTTYAIVTNEVPQRSLVDEADAEGFPSDGDHLKKKIANGTKKRKKGKNGLESYAVDCVSGPLARVVWSRVILDEAQTIKNHRTQVAKACCSLRAKRRWCLSGTPIQNTIDDLYSYFRFLRYEPYNSYKSFCASIKLQISRNSSTGYKKLQIVLRHVLLRRTKETLIHGEPIIQLPEKRICMRKVDFSQDERAFYTWLEAESRSKFKAFAAAGTVKQNYANILLMLLRLRQACDHPVLVKGSISDPAGKLSTEMVKNIPNDMVVNLLNHLAASSAICLVCNDPPENSVVTMCGHVFCYQCVSDYLIGDENTCPAPGCKEQLSSDNVFSEDILRSRGTFHNDSESSHCQFDQNSLVCQQDYNSAKVKAVLDLIHASLTTKSECSSGAVKSIIFSQWTGMLDLVEYSLKNYVINFRRLDGTMSLAARDKAVKDFNTDHEVAVMLMSLKAGNLGLNMVAASHVILLDLWWNPTTEDQAIDRAHRIGQTRPVTVTRVTVKNTVEDRILALQEEKRKMVASAFGEDQTGTSASRLTLEDLQYLFNADV